MTRDPRGVVRTALMLVVASLPAVTLHDLPGVAAALWPVDGSPYWVPSHLLLLWVAVPLVTLSACVLFLAPGLMLALAANGATTVSSWVVAALPFALGTSWLVVQLLRVLGPGTTWLAAAVMVGALLLASAVAVAVARRRPLAWPAPSGRIWAPLAIAAGAVVLLAAALAPKFLWESLNGDGAHALEVSRALLHQPWPFLPATAGSIAGFPGTTSMLFTVPNAWFIQLLGPGEAAVRLPFLLHLGLMAMGLQALAEEQGRRIGGRAVVALWLGLGAFVLAMAYSASYSPYHAGLALPAVQDTLFMACFLGFALAVTRRAWFAALVFALLTHASLPSGLLLMGFWLGAEVLVVRPLPVGVMARGAAILATCMAAAAGLAALLVAIGQPPPGTEYTLVHTVENLLRLDFTGWRRPIYWIVGAGIFPAVMLVRWRDQDTVARRVTVVTLCYFAFFLFQVRLSLHHLVPAMVLPAVVALRLRPATTPERLRYLRTWGAAALVALALSWPVSLAIGTTAREVGQRLAVTLGPPDGGDPRVYAASDLLLELFPAEWMGEVPDDAYGGSPLTWLAYATPQVIPGRTAYLLQSVSDSAPAGGMIIAERDDARLVVLNATRWAADRARRPPINRHALVYTIPRTTLFGADGPHVVDLTGIARRFGLPLGGRDGP